MKKTVVDFQWYEFESFLYDSKNIIYFFVCAETSYIHKKNFFKFAHCSVMMQVQLFLLTQYKQQIKKEGMINSCYFYGKGRRIHNAIFRIMNYVCSLPWKHKSWLVYLKQLLIVRVFFFCPESGGLVFSKLIWGFSTFHDELKVNLEKIHFFSPLPVQQFETPNI